MISKTCEWCGKPFLAEHPATRYCSKKCKQEGYKDKTRQRQYRFYHKYGKARYKKKNPYMGTGNLGQHAREDSDVEFKKVQEEFKRIGLTKHGYEFYGISGILCAAAIVHTIRLILFGSP